MYAHPHTHTTVPHTLTCVHVDMALADEDTAIQLIGGVLRWPGVEADGRGLQEYSWAKQPLRRQTGEAVLTAVKGL